MNSIDFSTYIQQFYVYAPTYIHKMFYLNIPTNA